MKVCLIGYYDEGQYGLRCLETTLSEAGHDVDLIVLKSYDKMFIHPTGREYELLTDLVRDLRPDLIGITVRSPFVWLAKDITERLRGNAPILWGGFHTTVAPDYSIQRPDMILRGEADRSFPMLANALSQGGNLSEIPGLWWKEGGEIRKNPFGPLIEDLDSLPFPLLRREHRWFIENNCLIKDDPLLTFSTRFYPMMASRGCPQVCAYCANAALIKLFGRSGKLIRLRDPKRVVEEVRRFESAYGEIYCAAFMDEVFGYKPTWVKEFCALWKKEIGKNFHAEIHPSLVREELIAELKDAGLSFLNMGIQSGSERVRKDIYDRPTPNKQILEAAQIIHRHRVPYRVEFISGNPLENVEDLKETLDLKLELPRPHLTLVYQLTYFPGTPITERFLKEGIISHKQVTGLTEDYTSTWTPRIDLNDGHLAEYYFYLYLNLIADFLYYYCEYHGSPIVRPNFYPRWFVRWLERREWLRRNPKTMLALTDKLGKFAHWSWFWTSYFPERFGNKVRTAWKLAKTGDVDGLKKGLTRLAGRLAVQLGFRPLSASTENRGCQKP